MNPAGEHYLKEKLVKMGRWAIHPADCETWQTESSSRYFEEFFGIGKGSLQIFVYENGGWYCLVYFPAPFFERFYNLIRDITAKDPKGLEKKLLTFYPFRKKVKEELSKLPSDNFPTLSNGELVSLYTKNRDLIHHNVIFDQFGWIGEEYWSKPMEEILTNKLGLIKGTAEYNEVLFTLTKPHEISTTLTEKRAVLEQVLAIKNTGANLYDASQKLARAFGWMPVFVYGTPWDAAHYQSELEELLKRGADELKHDFEALKNYSQLRDETIAALVKKYAIAAEDLQTFTDFGLALDARNEAEYVVSFGGQYLVSIYSEIARRFGLTVNQVRTLYEEETVACLEGRADPWQLLEKKKEIVAWGFSEDMRQRVDFTEKEARELWAYAEVPKNQSLTPGASEAQTKRGVTASRGVARGKARIVASPVESYKVERGDILITYATTVDYLPAMKKAGAIVTEVGGLTCHAAVVSREFGIPCVVSFKKSRSMPTKARLLS